jgi:hypothetical protein
MTVIQNELTTPPPPYNGDPHREAIKLVAKQILKGELIHKSKVVSQPIMIVGCAVIFLSGYAMALCPFEHIHFF